MNQLTRRLILLMACVLISACNYDTLYSNLDEQQVNEMLALLLRSDLDSRKIQAEKGWDLQVTESDLPAAVQILKSYGYPRDRYQSLGDVFKKEGFVSSPLEERARLLHGLSQELSHTISKIDGVLVARVHLAIPEKDVLSETRSPSSASIFIKHRPESVIVDQLGSIKALVVNSVEGLPYDNVTVTLFAAEEFNANPVVYEVSENTAAWSLPDIQNISRQQVIIIVIFLFLLLMLLRLKKNRRGNKNGKTIS